MSIAATIETFMRNQGVSYKTISHRLAYTAQEEAAVAHVPGKLWAKTVVCITDKEPILAVLPAHHSVDLESLRHIAGARTLRLAQERELAFLYPGCEVGAQPPLGPLYHQRVFVDRALAEDPEVVFNAGTHTEAIRMRYMDFADVVMPTVGEFSIPPGYVRSAET